MLWRRRGNLPKLNSLKPAFLQAILPFIPAILSGASTAYSMFGKKKTSGGEMIGGDQNMPEWQRQLGEQLGGWASRYMDKFVPGEEYGGSFTAGMTPNELASMAELTDFQGKGATGDLYAAGKQQIMDTLSGKYADAKTSPFIQSMIKLSGLNLKDSLDAANAKAGAAGKFFTGRTLRGKQEMGQKSAAGLDTLIAAWMDQERNKMFDAAGKAQAMDEYGNLTAPLKKIAAGQTFGALPRLIAQADLEAQYQDFTRKRNEQAMPLQVAQGVYGSNPRYNPVMQAPIRQESDGIASLLQSASGLNWGSLSGNGSIWTRLAGLLGGN